MRGISLLIKPASGLCNMGCRYCFYKEELAHSQKVQMRVMTDEVSEQLIDRLCAEADSWMQLTFQGGEPTLAGFDFYKRFVRLIEKKKKTGVNVRYSIQTNGLLIDDQWAQFLYEHHFLVGLSYDGTPQIHDKNRVDFQGKGTAQRAETAWKLLRKYQVETNLLCVVTKQIARKPESVYRYLKEMGGQFLQFIPCIASAAQEKEPWFLKPEDYGYFLKGLFDAWYRDWQEGHYISVRNLDDYVNLLCGRQPSSCAAYGQCGGYLVIENDGNVYPCDFFVQDGRLIGNIREQSFEELLNSDGLKKFAGESFQSSQCRTCRYYSLCRGGCKNDYRKGAHGIENRYCAAYQDFFSYALERLVKIYSQEVKSKISFFHEIQSA